MPDSLRSAYPRDMQLCAFNCPIFLIFTRVAKNKLDKGNRRSDRATVNNSDFSE